jgi:exopolysaccharide biosynthesis polyprenyl glycosylphosphotransferase
VIRQRARLVGAQMALVDLVLLVVAFRLAFAIRGRWPLGELPSLYPFAQYLVVMVVAIPTTLAALWLSGVYRYRHRRSYAFEVTSVVKALVVAGVVVATLAFLLKWQFLSRSFLVLFFATALVLLTAFKILARVLFHLFGQRSFEERNIVIVGTGDTARELATVIRANRRWGLRLLGFVATDESELAAGETGSDGPGLGSLADLARIVDRMPVDEVVFAVSRESLPSVDSSIEFLEQMGIRTRLLVNWVPRSVSRLSLEEFQGFPLLTLSAGPDNEIRLALRRVFDLAVAGAMLLLASPLLLLTCLLVKIEDGGPILFRQVRCGLNGRKFTLLKLRTMVTGADEQKRDLLPLNEMTGPVFKIKRDPRVTRVGAYLRRFSVDELPQLLNVLAGDMALVGPRPPVPDEVAQYQRWQRRRLSMKPGMTGLWQVSGRSEVDFEDWMRLDLSYIDNWSFWLDVKILLKTVPAVLSGRGAR